MTRKVRKSGKLVFGWGVNDVDYSVTRKEIINGKLKQVWTCPYYVKWYSMLRRCFCPKCQERQPTYKGCTICEDWKYLSSFIRWVDNQPIRDWQDCEADKDFFSGGNKHYSPETVIFVSKMVNGFITNCRKSRGEYIIGVSRCNKSKKNPYSSTCRNPFGGTEYLGLYSTELEAHKTWQAKKHEFACILADLQLDLRIASRLREMYSPDKDWTET